MNEIYNQRIDRDTGRAKSMVVDNLNAATLLRILKENIAIEVVVYTDEAKHYGKLSQDFADHDFTTIAKPNMFAAMPTQARLKVISVSLSVA